MSSLHLTGLEWFFLGEFWGIITFWYIFVRAPKSNVGDDDAV